MLTAEYVKKAHDRLQELADEIGAKDREEWLEAMETELGFEALPVFANELASSPELAYAALLGPTAGPELFLQGILHGLIAARMEMADVMEVE